MNENYNTPNSGCCGRNFPTAPENKCNYNSCCMNEYAYKQKACIRNKQPDCEAQAVIPSITVETVDGITNLANCLVHVTSTNTTYYVDDKHRIMITWAGPVNIPGYDMEGNPKKFKDQIVTDVEAETAVIYDNHGKGYIFGITPENLQQAVNDKLDEMAADGTLEGLISQYIEDVVFGFDTVAEMQTATNLVDGSYARTLGYYSVNDGGAALYKILEDEPSGYHETLNSGLYAELIEDNTYNVKQYGIKADGETDNSVKLNAILALGLSKIYFPNGTYYISSSITIPSTCKVVTGEFRPNTTIQCDSDGLIFEEATGIALKNLTIAKKAPAYQNIGIQGAFQGSTLNDVTVQGFDKGVYVNGNSWSNLYSQCRFIYCNYGYYKTNVGEIDWNDFFKCNLSYNKEAGAYIICNNYNTNFTTCDFEYNKKAVAAGYNPRNLIIDEGYFYGNDIAFSSELGYSGNGDVTIQKCWINQPETETYSSGWVATAWCRTAPVQNNKACTITVKECDIYFHDLTDKPFAFTNAGTNNASMTVFNILENKYSGNDGVVPNNFPAEYFDLIDTTNFPKYLDIAFRLPVKTDLIYKTLDTHLHWMVSNRGVSNGLGNGSNLFHMFGFYEFTSTGSTSANFSISKTCSPWENYNNRFYGLVRYTDGTIQNSTISIQSEKIYIYGLDSSKTTREIVLDVWYGGASQLG